MAGIWRDRFKGEGIRFQENDWDGTAIVETRDDVGMNEGFARKRSGYKTM